MPRFVVVGHRATTSPDLRLEDLPGAGRLDVLVRCVGATLLTSHGLRAGVVLTLVLLGAPTPPRAIRLDAARLRSLNPDERSTASLLRRALGTHVTAHVWQPSTPGIEVARRDLASALDDALEEAGGGARLVVLEEGGLDARGAPLDPRDVVVVGDHLGFTADERALLAARGAVALSVGPVSLHADQAIVVLLNEYDRRAIDGAARTA